MEKGALYEVPTDGLCGSTISGDFYAQLMKDCVVQYVQKEIHGPYDRRPLG